MKRKAIAIIVGCIAMLLAAYGCLLFVFKPKTRFYFYDADKITLTGSLRADPFVFTHIGIEIHTSLPIELRFSDQTVIDLSQVDESAIESLVTQKVFQSSHNSYSIEGARFTAENGKLVRVAMHFGLTESQLLPEIRVPQATSEWHRMPLSEDATRKLFGTPDREIDQFVH